jgi:hypothetical protein
VLADATARCDERIGTEQLLPALFHASDAVAAQVLQSLKGRGLRSMAVRVRG